MPSYPPGWHCHSALPLQASAHDIGLLALLGAVQLAVPCLLVVRLSREAACPEIALLALLEVVFGVAWAWLGAGERPASETLIGGSIVLAALIGNELQSLRTTARSEARTERIVNSLWKLATSSTCRTFSAGRTRITVLQPSPRSRARQQHAERRAVHIGDRREIDFDFADLRSGNGGFDRFAEFPMHGKSKRPCRRMVATVSRVEGNVHGFRRRFKEYGS